MKFYSLDMGTTNDGWYIAGMDDGTGGWNDQSINPVFEDGSVFVQSYDGSNWTKVDTGLTYTEDAWHTVKIVVDYSTNTYDMWLDDATHANAADMPFTYTTADINTMQHVKFGTRGKPSEFYIDDVMISTVPEPSTMALLLIGALGIVVGYWRKR